MNCTNCGSVVDTLANIDRLTAQVQRLQSEIASLQEALDVEQQRSFDSDVHLRKVNSELRAQIERLQEQLTAAEQARDGHAVELSGVMAERSRLKDRVRVLETELRDFAENYDCDEDAHKYGTNCRVCAAKAALTPAPAAPRTNGGIRCDVDDGPCACGAWHESDEPNVTENPVREPAETPAPKMPPVCTVCWRPAGEECRAHFVEDIANLRAELEAERKRADEAEAACAAMADRALVIASREKHNVTSVGVECLHCEAWAPYAADVPHFDSCPTRKNGGYQPGDEPIVTAERYRLRAELEAEKKRAQSDAEVIAKAAELNSRKDRQIAAANEEIARLRDYLTASERREVAADDKFEATKARLGRAVAALREVKRAVDHTHREVPDGAGASTGRIVDWQHIERICDAILADADSAQAVEYVRALEASAQSALDALSSGAMFVDGGATLAREHLRRALAAVDARRGGGR